MFRFLASLILVVAVATVMCPIAQAQQSQAENTTTSALRLGTASEKVPAGTMLPILFNTSITSGESETGQVFTAFLEEDFSNKANPDEPPQIILPQGTLIRGRVAEIKKAGFFSRGGALILDFDHVVLPTGDLLPLDLNLSASNDSVKRVRSQFESEEHFAWYTDPGVSYKLKRSLDSGVNTLKEITSAGVDTGKNIAGGAGVIITAPLAAAGGAVAGTAVSTVKGAQAIFGKGEQSMINAGDKVMIDFGGSFIIPAN